MKFVQYIDVSADWYGIPVVMSVGILPQGPEYTDDDAPTWPFEDPEKGCWSINSASIKKLGEVDLTKTRKGSQDMPIQFLGEWAEHNMEAIEVAIQEATE